MASKKADKNTQINDSSVTRAPSKSQEIQTEAKVKPSKGNRRTSEGERENEAATLNTLDANRKVFQPDVSFEDRARSKRLHWITRNIAEDVDRELFLKRTLLGFLVYGVFVVCCIIHASDLRTQSGYHMYTAMKNHFIKPEFTVRNEYIIKFREIKSAEDFWYYLEYFVQILYNEYMYDQTYNPVRPTVGEEKKILMQNHVMGVARIRQLQVKNNSCEIHPLLRNIFRSCYSNYVESKKNKKKFGNGTTGTAWKYSTAEETGNLFFTGFIAYYGGDGYYMDFSTDKNKTMQMVRELKSGYWIRRETRVVFLDVSLYNANINTFCACKLIFEFPHIGGVIPYHSFTSIVLLHLRTEKWLYVTMACTITMYVLTFYYLLELIREAVYFKWRYLKQFWTYMEIALIVTTLVAAFMRWLHQSDVHEVLDKVRKNPNVYANLEHIAYWYEQYKNFTAIQLYFAYIKVFKFLNFNKTMGQLNNTIKKAKGDVLGFSIMFFIVFFAFAELGYLIFGEKTEGFKNFSSSMFTLLRTLLGDFDYTSIQMANRIMAPIYFICYIFFIFFVLLNMFLAIINDSYSDVKTEIAIAPDEMQMTEYLKIKFFAVLAKCGCIKPRKVVTHRQTLSVEEIDDVLQKCGFTDEEIETFLMKYLSLASEGDTTDVVLSKLEEQLSQQEESMQKTFQSIKPKDYFMHQEKIDQIDSAIEKCTDRIDDFLERLQKAKNVRKRRRVP